MTELNQSEAAGLRELLSKVETVRKAIIERISDAERQTTPEVIAAGDQVNQIVRIVKAHEEGREGFVQQSFDELISVMADYSKSAEKTLKEQSKSIGVATSMTRDIVHAGANIESLAASARLLTINAKILAASMKSQGQEVSTLAGEMKALSDEIVNNNKQIRQLTSTLLATLPQIDQTSSKISEDVKETLQKMNALERDANESYASMLDESRSTLDRITAAAYEALSHLQFHDPVVQRLKSIDTFVYNLLSEVASDAGIEKVFEAPMLGLDYVGTMTTLEIDEENENVAEAGEPILF
ncbi:MAG: hypothetical protein JXX14_08485 [Deltaproteobacteria bacterium]|nr:hypothetical protein [Deltaproteobacteria bacterium]